MKIKKIKLELNKQSIERLSEKSMSMINGGVQIVGTNTSDNLCGNTNIACVSKDVKCPTKVSPGQNFDNIVYETDDNSFYDLIEERFYTDDELGFWPAPPVVG